MTAEFAIICVAAVPATLYALIYGATAPWWRSTVGRALFTKALGLALLIDLAVLNHFVPEYQGRAALRIVVYVVVTAGLYLQLGALLNARRKAYRDR